MQYRSTIHLLFIPFLLTLSSPSLAEEESPTTLSPVVVTAARSEQPIETAPAHVTVIELDDIRRSGARTIPDLLKTEAGIHVRDPLGNGKTANVDLRGFGETAGSNTLVLVDGRRVNAVDLSGTDWLQIPLEQIERIEIVRGTGSILYGDNASGGVINIITRTPAPGIQVQLGTDFGSYDDDRQWATLGGGTDLFAFSFSGSLRDSDGYRENNFLDSKDLGASLRFYPTDRLTLGLNGSIHEDEYGMPGALTAEEMQRDRRISNSPNDQATTRDRYLRATSEYDFGKKGMLAIDLSVRERENDSYFEGDFGSSGTLESDLDTWSLTPKYAWSGQVFGFDHQITTGADLYWNDLNSILDSVSDWGSYSSSASVEKNSQGYYLNDRIEIRKNLLLSAGIRYENAEYSLNRDADFQDSLHAERDVDENAWSLGLTWLYADSSSAYLRTNRSFRFPAVDEMINYNTNEINKSLKPQNGMHYEAGIRHHFTPFLSGKFTLFRADIEDEIFLNRSTPPFGANENHPETRHEGIETGFDLKLGDYFGLDTNYTFTRAKFEAAPFNGSDIPAVPRHQASARLVVEDLYPGLTISALYNYVGKRYAISDQANALGKVDAYETVDLRAAYGRDYWSLYAGVNNLFDEEYSNYVVASDSDFDGVPDLNYYPSPERNWVAGLEVSF